MLDLLVAPAACGKVKMLHAAEPVLHDGAIQPGDGAAVA